MKTFDRQDLNRRQVLKGAAALPLASFSLATVLGDAALAQETAQSLEMVTLTTKAGRQVSGALALPSGASAEAASYPAVLLIHEWWGLNDQIKTVARALADEGYVVLAADLYDGAIAADAAAARFNVRNVKPNEASDTLTSWASYLRGHALANGKLGTCGWCFGGGWSLGVSLAAPVDATVVYYGDVDRSVDELRSLKGPLLGHFGTRDLHINHEMVDGFETRMKKAGRVATLHWYEADHAFANPTTARYDEEDTALAWSRTLEFYKTYLT